MNGRLNAAMMLLVPVFLVGCNEEVQQASMAQSCADLADALGFPRTGDGKFTEEEDGYQYVEGEDTARMAP
jgi:hypothetical protein